MPHKIPISPCFPVRLLLVLMTVFTTSCAFYLWVAQDLRVEIQDSFIENEKDCHDNFQIPEFPPPFPPLGSPID